MAPGKKHTNTKKELLIQYIMKINSDLFFYRGFVLLGSILLLGFVIFCLFFLI